MKRNKLRIIMTVASIPFAIVLLYLGFLFLAHDFNPHFLDIDRCLDSGGMWNYEENICITSEETITNNPCIEFLSTSDNGQSVNF